MRRWELSVALNKSSSTPLFRQISQAIIRDINRGTLRPGDSLPGSRALASQLGVNRNTVIAAYEGLMMEGWLDTRPAGGTFVSHDLPVVNLAGAVARAATLEPPRQDLPREALRGDSVRPITSAAAAVPETVGFDIPPPSWAPDVYPWQRHASYSIQTGKFLAPNTLFMGAGLPDMRLFPSAALGRAYRRVLRHDGAKVLGLGPPQGHPGLRSALTEMLHARRGMAITPENLMVLRGSLMALNLAGRTLFRPGDRVAVETPGYTTCWEVLHGLGVQLIPIPVDHNGLKVDHLRAALKQGPIKGVFVTPHHQYPTTVLMSAARRIQLLRLAHEHRFVVIEDDYDHEYHYEGHPVRPLASTDRHGVVVYIGSLSKIMAPGLRVGFVTGPRVIIDRMAAKRSNYDIQGDFAQEQAIAELMEEGEIDRHVRRMRRVYLQRRNALVSALETYLPNKLSYSIPEGGMSVWATLHDKTISADALSEAAACEGVAFFPGSRFTFDGSQPPSMRLSFAALSEEELDEAARRLAIAYDKVAALQAPSNRSITL